MSKSRNFTGVTNATWECIKVTSEKEHETKYTPEGASKGQATTPTVVGEVILDFDYTPATDSVTYTIAKKPFIVSSSQIWDGLQETIDHCNG